MEVDGGWGVDGWNRASFTVLFPFSDKPVDGDELESQAANVVMKTWSRRGCCWHLLMFSDTNRRLWCTRYSTAQAATLALIRWCLASGPGLLSLCLLQPSVWWSSCQESTSPSGSTTQIHRNTLRLLYKQKCHYLKRVELSVVASCATDRKQYRGESQCWKMSHGHGQWTSVRAAMWLSKSIDTDDTSGAADMMHGMAPNKRT